MPSGASGSLRLSSRPTATSISTISTRRDNETKPRTLLPRVASGSGSSGPGASIVAARHEKTAGGDTIFGVGCGEGVAAGCISGETR